VEKSSKTVGGGAEASSWQAMAQVNEGRRRHCGRANACRQHASIGAGGGGGGGRGRLPCIGARRTGAGGQCERRARAGRRRWLDVCSASASREAYAGGFDWAAREGRRCAGDQRGCVQQCGHRGRGVLPRPREPCRSARLIPKIPRCCAVQPGISVHGLWMDSRAGGEVGSSNGCPRRLGPLPPPRAIPSLVLVLGVLRVRM